MITENKDLSTIIVTTDSGKLSCQYASSTQNEMKKIFNIDIGKEIEKMLINEEYSGYQPGEYTFSFANKVLSLHHKDIKEEIKNNVSRILKRYIYEKNDEDTRLNVTVDIKNYLTTLHEKGSLYDFTVICDESNNTTITIEKNILICRVGLKLTKNSNVIILDATAGALTSDLD